MNPDTSIADETITVQSQVMSATTQTGFLDFAISGSESLVGHLHQIKRLSQLSDVTGGFVQLSQDYNFLPALVGKDGKPVFLYQLVEMLEGYLDFDGLLAEFPTLNFSQIAGAISFLRKTSQINLRQVDIDELEDQLESEEFMDDLRQAFEERGNIARVLTNTD